MGCLEERSSDATSSSLEPATLPGRRPRPGPAFQMPWWVSGSTSWAPSSGSPSLHSWRVPGPPHRGVCASASRFPLQLLLGTVRSHLQVSLTCSVGLSAFLPCWKRVPGTFSRGLHGRASLGARLIGRGSWPPGRDSTPLVFSELTRQLHGLSDFSHRLL